MKKNILCTVLSGLAVFAFVGEAVAQPQINRSAYFLGGATYRHELNPAFMGERGYVSMPGLGNLSVGAQGTAGLINLEDDSKEITIVIQEFNTIGIEYLEQKIPNLHSFDKYILKHFMNGIRCITTNQKN